MSSLHQSRARVSFDSACAFGLAASSGLAWVQTYATAFLPVAGIAGLWGLVRLFDMRQSAAAGVAEEPVVVDRSLQEPSATPEPVAVEQPTYVQPAIEDVLANVKRSRKSSRSKAKKAPEPKAVAQVAPEPLAIIEERAVVEPGVPSAIAPDVPAAAEPEAPLELDQPTAEVVQHPAQAEAHEPEPDYAPPVVPLFEAEPFVRNPRRAAFGRKAG